MVIKSKKSDASAQKTGQSGSSDTVVFGGDGEPQTPELLVERLGNLLAEGRLKPDAYSLGGSVEELETRMADELGKEAAIWLPTGTLANQLALRRLSGTKSRVILQEQSHIYQDEGDALDRLSSLNAIPLADDRPYFTADELRVALKKSVSGRVLNPVGSVCIESPVRRQAGQIVPWDEMVAITDLCREEGIPTHLDGARLYMMSAATGIDVKKYTALFDSVYVSSYKYFGSPFGGVLAGRSEFIEGLYHDRRMFGGGIPFGYMAAALTLDGLEGFVERYGKAFAKAKTLFEQLNEISGIEVHEFEHGSNIFELVLDSHIDMDKFVSKLRDEGIVIPPPSSDWEFPVLHVNTTVLRRSNDEIARGFAAAAFRGSGV